MRDNTGRNIDYLRISVTDRCNLRCIYCMPKSGVPVMEHSQVLRLEEITHLAALINSVAGLRKIRITGGEPLVRKGVVSLVKQLAPIAETVMTTNGILLAKYAEDLASAGLSRVNISVDSIDDEILQKVTRRAVFRSDIENAVAAARKAGLEPVKLNCVALEGINTGQLGELVKWASGLGTVIRFIEHMPMEGSVCSYFSGNDVLEKLSNELGELTEMEVKGTARMYKSEQGYTFGLIAPVCTDMCNQCTRLRLTADGKLLPCLAGGEPLDLRSMLRGGAGKDTIRDAVSNLILTKPEKGRCGGVRMWRIGG